MYSAFNETSPQGTQVWITQGWFTLIWFSPLLIYRPRKDERLSWPSWLTYSGRYTHISGHKSATDRAEARESSLARDRRSNHWTTQPAIKMNCCSVAEAPSTVDGFHYIYFLQISTVIYGYLRLTRLTFGPRSSKETLETAWVVFLQARCPCWCPGPSILWHYSLKHLILSWCWVVVRQLMKLSDGSEMRVPVTMAAWNHLCVTWTRLTGYVSVYVNATLILDVRQPTLTRFIHDGASIQLGSSCCTSSIGLYIVTSELFVIVL